MSLDDQSYFRRRALEEGKAARNASCKIARARHTELAALYRGRCSSPTIRRAFEPMVGHEARSCGSRAESMLGA
jgi:hypothetical protein